ncbi:MAG: tetratricopeptide repeat protein [Desulfobacterales bacterium]|nr:tetratricopeptide repeat protein [Desulfobacterales bacterium]
MEKIAKEAEKFSDKNPKLLVLYGFIYYDQGRVSKKNKEYENALELYGKALTFGDHWSFYNERAKIYYYELKSYDQALENANRSIELRPVLHQNHLMRARIYFVKGNYTDSVNDLRTAEMIKPGESEIQEWKKWSFGNILKTNAKKAVEYYNLALEFDNNFEIYYWRGAAFIRLRNFKAALPDFKTAIKINPHHFESYRMIDYILAQKKQWDTIISYWNTFLELEPDHAGAYFERSGSHYHSKNFENAVKDLKKACELGNKDACKRYNMVKNNPEFREYIR